MKQLILAVYCTVFLCTYNCMGQAKKPTIMVVPSDVWCNKNGYMQEYDNQGTKVKVPDYKRAFQENADLVLVISKINQLMADRGFPLKNMESSLKTLESESAENAMLTSKGGSGVSESPVDKLKKVAKADIWMQITWEVNKNGGEKSITFNIQGLDAYTDKQVAGASGVGSPASGLPVATLLQEAVVAHLDAFNAQLQSHFDDMFKNGREIIVRIKKFDSWDGDLEKEYGGKELSAVIEDWMKSNCVQGRFSTTDATTNMMLLEQVRMPLFDASGNAIDARGFLKGLQKFLNSAPYSITNKLMTKGLGQAVIVLGDK